MSSKKSSKSAAKKAPKKKAASTTRKKTSASAPKAKSKAARPAAKKAAIKKRTRGVSSPPRPSTRSEKPVIPDHEMLEVIGQGAYGQVWMARSATGALRAVKVLRREDFNNGSTFEREFEGIRHFEPISREHPSLIDILQIGRNDKEHYYYYVMELADDVQSGQKIDPDNYRPDSLGGRLRAEEGILLDLCVEEGSKLAEGLGYLHSKGLIHRDIKPGNIIFINGECRLADVGLVADAGDEAFVGTEGFVAPEGPGTPTADIFSLAMVLYELSTRKDRLDFPDVPSNLENETDRPTWRRVNRAVLRAGALRPESRYQKAEELAAALRGDLQEKENHSASIITGILIAALMLIAVLFLALKLAPTKDDHRAMGVASANTELVAPPDTTALSHAEFPDLENSEITTAPPDGDPTEAAYAEIEGARSLHLSSEPLGALVYEGEKLLGSTPLELFPAPPESARYYIRLSGYRNVEVDFLGDMDEREEIHAVLEEWNFPQPGMSWANSLDMNFFPFPDGHLSETPMTAEAYLTFAATSGTAMVGEIVACQLPSGEQTHLIALANREIRAFTEWMSEQDRARGLLSAEHSYQTKPVSKADYPGLTKKNPRSEAGQTNFHHLLVNLQKYGTVLITSDPPGAAVLRGGLRLGVTPLELPRIKVGLSEFELQLAGQKSAFVSAKVKPDGVTTVDAILEPGEPINFDRAWHNSLGMMFLPVGDHLLGAWEIRRQDFALFLLESDEKPAGKLSARNRPLHAMTGISLEDAQAFCEWLTEYERERGDISQAHVYRLPTDSEWSRAVGLSAERGRNPSSRRHGLRGLYPWGFEWPPPAGAGNFADQQLKKITKATKTIKGYADGYAEVMPVDAIAPDQRGLYHLAGNVWEWVDTPFGGNDKELAANAVLRGGSWKSYDKRELWSSARKPFPRDARADDVGFRCLLSRESSP